ncbi:MAG TPA: hypothetical protein VMU89_11720 [Thermomicrobiaceae bacterium]|nr:hypothetical protein [Thermomicrobiaceae bacterium]
MAEPKTVVVDGSNVAYEEVTPEGKPKVANLVAVRRELERRGYRPIIIVDAAFRHQVDDPRQLEALIDDQVVRQAPAGTDADYFVLTTAADEHAAVVSNDLYRPYEHEFPWVRERRIPLMIVDGNVELYEPKRRRAR